MKQSYPIPALTLVLLLFNQLFYANAQVTSDPTGFRPINPPYPALLARDVTEEAEFHDVRLTFPASFDVDPATFSDGDILAMSPNGDEIEASFIEFNELPIPFPLPLDPRIIDHRVEFSPRPALVIVASFRFPGPWTAENNGAYRVRLKENAIANLSGRFFPAKALGGFRVTIEDETFEPIQPTRTDIDFRRQLGSDGETIQYLADVTLTFAHGATRIDWGELTRFENTFTANISAVHLPILIPHLPIVIPADRVAEHQEIDPSILPPLQLQFRHTYELGSLTAGTYELQALVNEIEEATDSLTIPDTPTDTEGPEISLVVRNITQPNSETAKIAVTYEDPSGIDLDTLGDDDLIVFTPWTLSPDLPNSTRPIIWNAQNPRLTQVLPLDRRLMKVRAIYELEAPRGGWNSSHNGFYPVVIQRNEVCDSLANCNRHQRLGGFEVSIDDSEPPIEASAEITVDASDPNQVAAKVHIDFEVAHILTNQSIRRDGNRIILVAEVEMDPENLLIDPSTPGQLDLSYEIGPLRRGEYVAAFVMNGTLYDREAFSVAPSPPIPANVDLVINDSGTEATVTLQFRTPHLVTQNEVILARGRVILPAKAEALPLPHDLLPIPIPEPIVLTYSLGDLDPGSYLGVFEMNEFAYATEEFTIEDSSPPIPADVTMRIAQYDNGRTTAHVRIIFETPHFVAQEEPSKNGNHFVLEANARPLIETGLENEFIRPSRIVELDYDLGPLSGGDYRATFIMNGHPYARTTWTESEIDFDAEVETEISSDLAGNWTATVRVSFEDNQIRMEGPGTLTSEGRLHSVRTTAFVTQTDDLPPEFYEFSYDLGQLEAGPHFFKFFINDRLEDRTFFRVTDFPAEIDLAFDTSGSPDTAKVTITSNIHYRITDQSIRRVGNLILLKADAEVLPTTIATLPEPICLDYDLGDLRPGNYVGVFMLNGERRAFETFRVERDGFEAEVKLETETTSLGTTLTATVDIDDPFVIVTDPGMPNIVGNRISINATAERVDFVQEPSGDAQEVSYDLGQLSPGRYIVDYRINNRFEARLSFEVEQECNPLPHLASLRINEEREQWFSILNLALFDGQQLIDWGTVTRNGNAFEVSVRVECADHESPVPVQAGDIEGLPEGLTRDEDGKFRLAELPIELISHTYQLGELEAGAYSFCVKSRGQTLACRRFRVEDNPASFRFDSENITEPKDKHEFTISYNDRIFNDSEVRAAAVWITGPDGYREEATLENVFGTADVPMTAASFTYSVNGPDGSWDRPDNGGYRAFIDASAITGLEEPFLGRFSCRILPQPNPGVDVTFGLQADGNWQATVVIQSEDTQQVVIENQGPLVLHGQSFIALATLSIQQVRGPVEPIAITYDLGQLQPGYYAFAFKSNLAHCGTGSFTVPGIETTPLNRWATLLGLEEKEALSSYFFALHPESRSTPDLEAEIIEDEFGKSHLGLRFQRLTGAEGIQQKIEASIILNQWEDVSDQIDIVERTLNDDGTEELLICLRQAIDESPYRFLRVHLIEED